MVEQGLHKAEVVGSSPTPATIYKAKSYPPTPKATEGQSKLQAYKVIVDCKQKCYILVY